VVWNETEMQQKWQKNTPKWGPEKRVSGAPGRGVLQKSLGAYRNPVHFLPIFAFFSLFLQI